MQNIVFTFVGDDKAGLVERIAQIVARHDGNWLESRLAQMAGKFAGIVSVAIAEQQADALLEALAKLADDGLSVVAERSHTQAGNTSARAQLNVLGNDRPGIVHEVSAALAAMQINILKLSSEVQSAPMAGIPLFVADIIIQQPPEAELSQLRDKLEQAANRLDIDISLQLNPGSETPV